MRGGSELILTLLEGGTYLIFPLVKLILGPPPFLIIIAQSLIIFLPILDPRSSILDPRPSTLDPDFPVNHWELVYWFVIFGKDYRISTCSVACSAGVFIGRANGFNRESAILKLPKRGGNEASQEEGGGAEEKEEKTPARKHCENEKHPLISRA